MCTFWSTNWFLLNCRFAYRIVALYYTDRICLEPLTAYMHMSDVRNGHLGHMCHAARALDALVIALDQILAMYKARLLCVLL